MAGGPGKQGSSGPPRPKGARLRGVLGFLRELGPRRLRMIILSFLAAVALVGGGAWVLYGSSWLRVERATVSGTDVLTPAEVLAAAKVPVGEPLVSVDTDAIEARLRRQLPRIADVDVVRSWPHGIGLKVTERTPVLLLKKGGTFTEVDGGGVRFATVTAAPKGVPLLELSLSPTGSTTASLRRFGEDRLVREAVRTAGDLPATVRQTTRTVKVRSYDDISLDLTDGRTVSWGSSEQGAAKARALGALLKAASDARHFDVSVPTAPASAAS